MPLKEKPIKKLFYPIGEIAKIFGISVSAVRYWEKEFDILKPKKNKKGNRMFTKKDVDKWHEKLKDYNIDVIGPTNHDDWIYSIYFFDPNGLRLEITTELEKDR